MTSLCRQSRAEALRLEQAFKQAQAYADLCQAEYRKVADAIQQLRREFTAEDFPTDEETADYEQAKARLEQVQADALAKRQLATAQVAPLQLAALSAGKEFERLLYSHRNLKAKVPGHPMGVSGQAGTVSLG